MVVKLSIFFIALVFALPAFAFDDTELVSYWSMEEESGVRVDSHGSNDLTDNNTVLFTNGIIGNGADFDSTNSEYLSILDSALSGLDFQTDTTINFWLKRTTDASMGWFAHNYQDTAGCTTYYYNPSGVFQFICKDPALNSTVSFPLDTWTMHTVTYDSGTFALKQYVNGEYEGTVSLPSAIVDPSTEFLIGTSYWTDYQLYFDGVIDEVSYWSMVLSDSDITALYNSGVGLSYEETTGYTATSTATTTTSTTDNDDLIRVISLYMSVFVFMATTIVGYKFTKLFF